MKDSLKIVGAVIATILVIDMISFGAWVVSGQHPVDNFYFGTITAHVLQLILK